MSYIKVEKEVPDDPRLVSVATEWEALVSAIFSDPARSGERYALLSQMALGALVRLWRYADTYVQSDDTLPVTIEGLAGPLGLPVDMLRRLPECWLKVRPNGRVSIPGYVAKNRITGKDLRKTTSAQREGNRRRQARFRHNHRNGNDGDAEPSDVTPVDVTPVSVTTGTGTGTYRPRPVPETKSESLASAVGRLAIRENGNGHASSNGAANGGTAVAGRKPKPATARREPKSRATLRDDVRMLTSRGVTAPDVVRMLAQHGVTETDVSRWLTEPEGSPP